MGVVVCGRFRSCCLDCCCRRVVVAVVFVCCRSRCRCCFLSHAPPLSLWRTLSQCRRFWRFPALLSLLRRLQQKLQPRCCQRDGFTTSGLCFTATNRSRSRCCDGG